MRARSLAALTDAQVEELERVGALRLRGAIKRAELQQLIACSDHHNSGRPGERIDDLSPLIWLLGEGAAGQAAQSILGSRARPVRALLFDKTAANNWALGWHQDRTIAVRNRIDLPGFHIWTVKSGVPHVEPPFELIERTVTLRIHLDAVDDTNAPLRVAPGSHRMGRLAENAIEQAVAECGELCCLADAGDVWIYRTAILHASSRAEGSRRRRVLQVDFSAEDLPDPLEWWAADQV